MIIDIPFELGQKVWVWENRPTFQQQEYRAGYDHLGVISGYRTIHFDHWGAHCYPFKFDLLDKYKIEDIFTSKEECEMKNTRAW